MNRKRIGYSSRTMKSFLFSVLKVYVYLAVAVDTDAFFDRFVETKLNIFKILFRTQPVRGNNRPICPSCYCGVSEKPRKGRIYDGLYVAPGEYPWTVLISMRSCDLFKSGTLINDLYVLTSASNVYMKSHLDLQVHVGKYQLCGEQATHVTSAVSSIIVYPGFVPDINIYDLALLELAARVDFDFNSRLPICLPSPGASYIGKLGIVVGFIQIPYDHSSDKIDTCIPRKVVLPIVHRTECNQPIYGFEMCLGVVGGQNIVCEDDSGAGVMHETGNGIYEIVGVVSDKQSCPSGENIYHITTDLAVMTSLAPVVKWIFDNTRNACYCQRI